MAQIFEPTGSRSTEQGYQPIERSRLIPTLDFAELARFVRMDDQHAAVKAYRAALAAPR